MYNSYDLVKSSYNYFISFCNTEEIKLLPANDDKEYVDIPNVA